MIPWPVTENVTASSPVAIWLNSIVPVGSAVSKAAAPGDAATEVPATSSPTSSDGITLSWTPGQGSPFASVIASLVRYLLVCSGNGADCGGGSWTGARLHRPWAPGWVIRSMLPYGTLTAANAVVVAEAVTAPLAAVT